MASVQAPMGWIARAQLASAVSRAGALGIIETSSGELDVIRGEIQRMRELTDRPFGINIAQAFVRDQGIVDLVIEQGVRFVTTSAGDPICDGVSMAAAFALGAEGVQMGTHMVSAAESPVHRGWKQAIVTAEETGTVFLRQERGPALRALRTERTTRLERGEGNPMLELGAGVRLPRSWRARCASSPRRSLASRSRSAPECSRALGVDARELLLGVARPDLHAMALDDAEAVGGVVDRGPEARVEQVDLLHRRLVQLVERHHLRAELLRRLANVRLLERGEIGATAVVLDDDVIDAAAVGVELFHLAHSPLRVHWDLLWAGRHLDWLPVRILGAQGLTATLTYLAVPTALLSFGLLWIWATWRNPTAAAPAP